MTWLVASMDDYLGSFPSKRVAIKHFAGTRSVRRPGCYEIIGTMDDPRAQTGRYIFTPDTASIQGLQWAVDAARQKGDIP